MKQYFLPDTWVYIASAISLVAVFFVGKSLLNYDGILHKTIYVVIPMELALVCLWAYLTGTLAFLKAGSRMEEKDYDKAYQNPIQALTVSILLYVFSFGGQIIGIVMNFKGQEKGDLYLSLILFLVLVISIVVWNRQRKVMHLVKEESKK